jgi:hypothetical protein
MSGIIGFRDARLAGRLPALITSIQGFTAP